MGAEQGEGAATWREANLLIDALAGYVPQLKARPAFTVVEWSGGRAHLAVRGTCCLYYKVSGHEPDPRGDAYCVTCPFRDERDRQRRWAMWLDEHAATAPEEATT